MSVNKFLAEKSKTYKINVGLGAAKFSVSGKAACEDAKLRWKRTKQLHFKTTAVL